MDYSHSGYPINITVQVIGDTCCGAINMWQSSMERKKHDKNKAGQSPYENGMGHSITGQSSLQRRMCHSTAIQDLVATKSTLTDSIGGPSMAKDYSTAGKSSLQRKMCHSNAGQDLMAK